MKNITIMTVLGFLFSLGFSCSAAKPCTPANCGTCCTAAGECVQTVTATQCGAAGNLCNACGSGQICSAGMCSGGGTGGGSGQGGGGGSATGGGSAAGGAGGGVVCNTPSSLPTIPVSISDTCPAFTACGGDPSGTFVYSSVCITKNQVKGALPIETFCGSGSVTLDGVDGGMSGASVFQSGTMCRKTDGIVEAATSVRGNCASELFCNLINFPTVKCSFSTEADGGGVCKCKAQLSLKATSSSAYTTTSTGLTLTDSGESYDTCLDGTKFTMKPVNSKNPIEPTGTLIKQ